MAALLADLVPPSANAPMSERPAVPLPVIFIVRLFLLLGSTRNDARAKDLLRTLTCDGHVLSINSLRVANALWFMARLMANGS